MAHIHEKIDFCSDTYIVNGNAVLLRMHDKYHVWLPPGGHIDLDEGPVEAAIREVKEEVGLDVKLIGEAQKISDEFENILAPRFLNRHRISSTHEHISFIYFATSGTRDVTQGETERSDQIKWFTKEELDDETYGIDKTIRFYAKKALEATCV